MSVTSELTILPRVTGERPAVVGSGHSRSGDTPAVQRLFGEVGRPLDAAGPDEVTPHSPMPGQEIK